MNIKDLIKKYEKEIINLQNDQLIEGKDEFDEPYCSEISLRQLFIQDLKEHEKEQTKNCKLANNLEAAITISPPENYPFFRERLICAALSGVVANGNIEPSYAIACADEIIKQMNEK